MTFEEVYKILYKKHKVARWDDVDKELKVIDITTISTWELFALIDGLKETYAPKIKMTKLEFEKFKKRFATSGMYGFKIELDKDGYEHSLYTNAELLAWLYPELIEVTDE